MKWLRRFWPYFLLALLVVVNSTVWIQRQAIADWWVLQHYKPTADISGLATDDTMTAYAEHLFYINKPMLEDKQSFNLHCSDTSKEVAVLGCYRGNRQGIFLYAVTDTRLGGVRQVTAAHEMLHQAYDRLSSGQRTHIDQLLEDYYKNHLTDAAVKSKLDSYKAAHADLDNEMHSIFGTEVRDLTPELETYYKQYFTDRLKVVGYRESYQAEFTRREDLVKQYDSQLASLKTKIDTNKATLTSDLSKLKAQEAVVNQDASSQNQTQYQTDVQAYNSMVDTYNGLLALTRREIDQYNQIVAERNAIAVQEQQLQEALDSRLNTTPAQQ